VRIPNVVVRDIQTPVIRNIDVPVTRPSVPVTRGIKVPVVRVPSFDFDYPVINVPLNPEEYDTLDSPAVGQPADTEAIQEQDTRDLPSSVAQPLVDVPTQPTIDIAGMEIPIPDPGVVATAGSVAVVTTAAGMGATIIFGQVKNALTPVINELVKKKFKVKIKQVKPVLHFVPQDDKVNIFEYSMKGTRLVDSVENVEMYLRDQVDINSLYEYDNKLLVDATLKDKFTKEGAKRFKNLFTPARSIAKKLSAKFSI
jgi:hypothetical protein